MPPVHCNTLVVDDPTDLLGEIARHPVLYLDDLERAEDTEGVGHLLRLSKLHGQAIRFRVEELDHSGVHWRWLGGHSAMALLSTPTGIQTLYLHLSGLNMDEEEMAVHYVHELVHGYFSMGQVRPRNRASSLVAFEFSPDEETWGEFAFLSKILHGEFCDICGVPREQPYSRL